MAKIARGVLPVALVLFGTSLQRAGAVEAPAKTHRDVDIAALGNVAFNRLNTIRSSFGLSNGAFTSSYSQEVSEGIAKNSDPAFAPEAGGIVAEEALWGVVSGVTTATAATEIVNRWVYHDGWQGSRTATRNAECTSPHAPGCDGHRRSVLSTPPIAGARLSIDVTTSVVTYDGEPALAVAALFVWKMP